MENTLFLSNNLKKCNGLASDNIHLNPNGHELIFQNYVI